MNEIEVLNAASNALVARHVDREFPGMLIQGDTLRVIFDDLEELVEELDANDIESAKNISEALKDRIFELLSHYESVLAEKNMSLPYARSVKS